MGYSVSDFLPLPLYSYGILEGAQSRHALGLRDRQGGHSLVQRVLPVFGEVNIASNNNRVNVSTPTTAPHFHEQSSLARGPAPLMR